jgi:hypothetical protein
MFSVALALMPSSLVASDGDGDRLVAAMLVDSPMEEDLQSLTDEIGGRPTGSDANLEAVEWALERFADAGVEARKESFTMPARWVENSATATVKGDGVDFSPRVVSMPFSVGTGPAPLIAPLIDIGFGTNEDFATLKEQARGAFLLVETNKLEDIPGLFVEYVNAAKIEARAFDAGAAGVVYMGSRSRDVLYRHNASLGPKNKHPLLIMERDGATRALRLLRSGQELHIEVDIDIDSGPDYSSYNVIGEIRGSAEPEEFVVIGAHLDSWGLGTGALDNGCNVALVIDIARQIKRLGIQPRRTIRFALFNGEEQGLIGSLGYVRLHADELDRHVMASSYDIGSGRVNGFFTGGRPEIAHAVEEALRPVAGFGPFTVIDVPIVGTDNFDFMIEGVGNLVANQENANYGPNYHARTDTFDRVDLRQMRLNAAVAAAVTWAFADMDIDWRRQNREEIQSLIDQTDLGEQMATFGILDQWESGERGRQD